MNVSSKSCFQLLPGESADEMTSSTRVRDNSLGIQSTSIIFYFDSNISRYSGQSGFYPLLYLRLTVSQIGTNGNVVPSTHSTIDVLKGIVQVVLGFFSFS